MPKRVSKRDSSFSLQADIRQKGHMLQIRNARGEIEGTPFRLSLDLQPLASGDAADRDDGGPPALQPISYRPEDTPTALALSANLETDVLDFSALSGQPTTAADLRRWISSQLGLARQTAGETPKDLPLSRRMDWLVAALGPQVKQVTFGLSAGTVRVSDFSGLDLDVRVNWRSGRVLVRRLSFAGGEGLRFSASGETVANGAKGVQQGRVKATLKAQTGPDLKSAARLLGMFEAELRDTDNVERILPLHLAIAAELRPAVSGGEAPLDLVVDGGLGTSHLKLTANLFGRRPETEAAADWRSRRISAVMNLDNEEGAVLLRQLFPQMAGTPLVDIAAGRGYLQITASGRPAEAMRTHADLKTKALRARVSGDAILGDGGNLNFTGRLGLTGDRAAVLYSLTGARSAPGRGAGPLALAADFKKSAQAYRFENIEGRIAEHTVKGEGSLNVGETGPVQIAGVASLSEINLPALLDGMVAWDENAVRPVVAADSTEAQVWPRRPVNLALFDAFRGQVKLLTPDLRLAEGIGAGAGSVKLTFAQDSVKLDIDSEELFAGKLALDALLKRVGPRIDLTGGLKLTGARLETLPGAENPGRSEPLPLAHGTFDLTADFSGSGVTPDGIIADLAGTGSAKFSAGAIHRFSTDAARTSLADVNSGAAKPTEFGERFLARLHSEDLIFPKQTLPFTISNGTVDFGKVRIADETGVVDIRSFLSLRSLLLDSEWQLLTSQNNRRGAQKLPPVKLVFAGPLADFGRLAPKFDTAPLERFLQVRKLKKDVERLEKLQRQIQDLKREKQQMKDDAGALQNWTTDVSPEPVPAP